MYTVQLTWLASECLWKSEQSSRQRSRCHERKKLGFYPSLTKKKKIKIRKNPPQQLTKKPHQQHRNKVYSYTFLVLVRKNRHSDWSWYPAWKRWLLRMFHWRSTMVDGLASSTSSFRWCMEQAKTPKCGAASFSFILLYFFSWKHSHIVAWSAKEVVALVAQLYDLFCFFK